VTLEPHKAAEIASRTDAFMAREASKPFGWEPDLWTKWATIGLALQRLGVPGGARVLDVAAGSGWTSLFLAESGYDVCSVDLVPANVELIRRRAARWGLDIDARQADMDALDLGERFAFALMFDALHHSTHQRVAVRRVAAHLAPGGWLLCGEPSWLHDISPHARRTERELGWKERGVRLRELRRDMRDAGLGSFRRFFGPTRPYEGRGAEFLWQLVRLVAANVWVAPQAQLWLAGQKRPS
jgi:SAM-dependent methyltransferase